MRTLLKSILGLFFAFVTISCSENNDIVTKLNTHLTTEDIDVQSESNDVNDMIKKAFTISVTRSACDSVVYPDYFGGTHINEDGSITIFYKKDSVDCIKKMQAICSSYQIKYKSCLFSVTELTKKMHFIANSLKSAPLGIKGNVVGMGINFQDNCIDIYVKNPLSKNIALFNKHFGLSAIKIYQSDNIQEASATSICPGYKLGLNSGSVSYGTFGFPAREKTGEKRIGMITAGHVFESINEFCSYEDYTCGMCVSKASEGTADAAFVYFLYPSYYIPSNYINGTTTSLLSTSTSEPGEGTTLNQWGATTGHKSGKLKYTSFIVVNDDGTTKYSDMAAINTSCETGDSGGLVYSYVSSKKTRYTVGIIHGYTTTSKLTIYSKAKNILNELNLERY